MNYLLWILCTLKSTMISEMTSIFCKCNTCSTIFLLNNRQIDCCRSDITFHNSQVMIFFSAHGVPLTYVTDAGDPYKDQMEDCIALIMEELRSRGTLNNHTLAYQVQVYRKNRQITTYLVNTVWSYECICVWNSKNMKVILCTWKLAPNFDHLTLRIYMVEHWQLCYFSFFYWILLH
jgi:hypothetical protein